MRSCEINRKTAETDIFLSLNLDGIGKSDIQSGCGFLDHMLTLFAKHARFDLTVKCQGDTWVDDHHTVEDIGICLGMVPLVAYNYASRDLKRMESFFITARRAGLAVTLVSVVLYRIFAPYLINAFIQDPETVRLGTQFLQARCFATPVMFLSFHVMHFMQATNHGKVSFQLSVIRQLCLQIPFLLILNFFFGMSGIVWTQAIADIFNVLISYYIFHRVRRNF